MNYYDNAILPTGSNQFFQQQLAPVQPQRPAPPVNDTKFIWIYGGTKSAKAYPQAPNMTSYYRDNEEPYLFEKTTDNYGKVIAFKKYRLTEEPDEDTVVAGIPTGNFVTSDDFNKFQADMNASIQNITKSLLDLNNKLDEKPRYNKNYQNKGRVNNE